MNWIDTLFTAEDAEALLDCFTTARKIESDTVFEILLLDSRRPLPNKDHSVGKRDIYAVPVSDILEGVPTVCSSSSQHLSLELIWSVLRLQATVAQIPRPASHEHPEHLLPFCLFGSPSGLFSTILHRPRVIKTRVRSI